MNNGNKVIKKENYEISNDFDDLIVKTPRMTTLWVVILYYYDEICAVMYARNIVIEKVMLKK